MALLSTSPVILAPKHFPEAQSCRIRFYRYQPLTGCFDTLEGDFLELIEGQVP
jgi:hypothetical protein